MAPSHIKNEKIYNAGIIIQGPAGKDHTRIYSDLISRAMREDNKVDLLDYLKRLFTEKNLPISPAVQEIIKKIESGATIKDVEKDLLDLSFGLIA
ncbi:hypothetical protein [Neobacillus sp. 19]|uniref:hypothetical protein n=1 Tax=Neobacillus sp. 19 TaxID=3394458 RepID=UPI003BF66886